MNEKLVSIIIPVYNIEKYLDECVKSVINQTYKKFELILIDDGSTDSSGSICDTWIKKDSRIKVIHKTNGGVSSARNLGLEKAQGDYCMFIDSDDRVETDYIYKLIENMNDYDMVSCGYKLEYKNNILDQKITEDNKAIDLEKAKNFVFEGYGYKGFLWNKIFKMNIIKSNNITFDQNIHMCEDQVFVINYLMKCTKDVYLICDCLYYYRMRKSSMVSGKNQKKLLTIFDAYLKMYNIFDNKIYIDFYRSVLFSYYLYKNNINKKYYKLLNIKNMKKEVYKSKEISLLRKIKLFITYNFHFIYKIRDKFRHNDKMILFD